jgi:hypothetical protein
MFDKLPSIPEQFSAVLNAPIPFFFAVVIVAVVIWRACEWAYRAVLNKRKELYDLSRQEVDRLKDNAEQTTKELDAKIALLEQQNLSAEETKTQLGLARQGVSNLTTVLDNLGRANSASQMDWTSSGWKPRNPS